MPPASVETSTLGKSSYFLSCGRNWAQVLVTTKEQTEGRGVAPTDRDQLALSKMGISVDSSLLLGRVQATYRVGATDPRLRDDGFVVAQRMLLNDAARALASLAARFSAGSGPLEALIREQQDRLDRRNAAYNLLRDNYEFGQISRIEETEDALRQRVADEDKALDAVEARLRTEFPNFIALAHPQPLSISDAQALLGDGEVLVLFLDMASRSFMAEETFIWAVTKTESRWICSGLGTKALTERVARLRCGLDSTNWTDASRWSDATEDDRVRKAAQIDRRELCKQLTGTQVSDTAPPPFDLAKSYELYQALFGDIADLVRGRQLLIVPSGPLSSLPFQVLVTQSPGSAIPANPEDYAKAPWLIRDHSITVLPSVGSLKALRQDAKASQATIPFIGFGNPLLGAQENDKRAFAKQSCPKSRARLRRGKSPPAPLLQPMPT